MTGGEEDGVLDSEQRRALETEVQRLLDSLQHWQTWDTEYEGLKEQMLVLTYENLLAANTFSRD